MERRRFVSAITGLFVLCSGCSSLSSFSENLGMIDVVLVNATDAAHSVKVTVKPIDGNATQHTKTFDVSPDSSKRISEFVKDGSYVFKFDVDGKSGGKLEYRQNECKGGQITLTIQENNWLRTTHSVCGEPNASGSSTSPTTSPDN
jgi:hypothetical protein